MSPEFEYRLLIDERRASTLVGPMQPDRRSVASRASLRPGWFEAIPRLLGRPAPPRPVGASASASP